MALTLEEKKLLTKAQTLGNGTSLPVRLSVDDLFALSIITLNDLGRVDILPSHVNIQNVIRGSYYDHGISLFSMGVTPQCFYKIYEDCLRLIPDFSTYFSCLCELHKRRVKYASILEAQPLPAAIQVSPRALLEHSIIDSPEISSWLRWRKWFYDIDNRAAQETGYLFEPILTNALGGVSYGSRHSPIRRKYNPANGRQVDCIVDTDAYEFKLRVTIAASGQGRFTEELDFANDCVSSKFRPILLVLDPTPNHRLTDLTAAYQKVGGAAFIGNDAWIHLEQRSGPTMTIFIEKYVRPPIDSINFTTSELNSLKISASNNSRYFDIFIGDKIIRRISRCEDANLASDLGDLE